MSAAESNGFTPPAAFGPYRVLHQIGSGVLGPVFRTYDPQNDRLVAVKAFRLEIVPEDVARLADSLRRLSSASLAHEGIVKTIDAGLEGMSAFLAMEYVSAETLDVALRHLAPAPLDRALPIVSGIAEAIESAWAAGFGHGSLHPRDVFVASGTNEIRITGFGVGQALESTGIRVPARRPYTAPERSTGGAWDIRADVYSLGAITHELLTKRRPGSAGEQDGSLVTGTTPEQRRLIRGVLGAALAEAPEHRFHSPRAFVEALGAIVRGEPVGPLPEGPVPAAPELQDEIKAAPAADTSAAGKSASRRPPAASRPVPLFAAAEIAEAVDSAASETSSAKAETTVAPPAAPSHPPNLEPTVVLTPAARDAAVAPPVAPALAIPASRAPAIPPNPEPTLIRPKPIAAAADAPPAAKPVHHVPIQHVEPIPHEAPRATHAHEATSLLHASGEPPPATPSQWPARMALLVMGIAVGLVGGYWAGMNHVGAPVVTPPRAVAANKGPAPDGSSISPPIPPGTDVEVPKENPIPAPPAPVAEHPAGADAKSAVPAPVKEPPPAPVGRLTIRSATAGAMVKVDGHSHGAPPVTLTDLTLGTHTVEVSKSGYIARTERITLTAATSAKTVTLDLQAEPPPVATPAVAARGAATATGSIFLDSRPSGARVLLDSHDAGKTPLTLPAIKVGSHPLRFELAGYKALDTSVNVRAGQQERVTVTLEQALVQLLTHLLQSPNRK